MSIQQRAELTTSVTPKNTRQEKTFVQVEGELTEAQLEAIGFASARRGASPLGRSAIAGGGLPYN